MPATPLISACDSHFTATSISSPLSSRQSISASPCSVLSSALCNSGFLEDAQQSAIQFVSLEVFVLNVAAAGIDQAERTPQIPESPADSVPLEDIEHVGHPCVEHFTGRFEPLSRIQNNSRQELGDATGSSAGRVETERSLYGAERRCQRSAMRPGERRGGTRRRFASRCFLLCSWGLAIRRLPGNGTVAEAVGLEPARFVHSRVKEI